MAKIAISLKILFVWIYNGFASLIVHSTAMAIITGTQISPTHIMILISFFLMMVFLPEILFIFWKTFRMWIMQGAEDGDGVFNSKDLKGLGVLYVSLWSMRIFMGYSLAKMFGVEIDTVSYLAPLIGSFGTAGLAIFKGILSKK